MQEHVDYLIAQQTQKDPISCSASLGDCFAFTKQNDHDNSSPRLHSDSNAAQSKPPAKSPEKSKSHDN